MKVPHGSNAPPTVAGWPTESRSKDLRCGKLSLLLLLALFLVQPWAAAAETEREARARAKEDRELQAPTSLTGPARSAVLHTTSRCAQLAFSAKPRRAQKEPRARAAKPKATGTRTRSRKSKSWRRKSSSSRPALPAPAAAATATWGWRTKTITASLTSLTPSSQPWRALAARWRRTRPEKKETRSRHDQGQNPG